MNSWYEITVFTTQAGLEAVCGRLDSLGVAQVAVEESRESVAAFLEKAAKYWDLADIDALSSDTPCVKAYVANLPENQALLEAIQTSFAALAKEDVGLDLGSLRLDVIIRDEEDWANNWKQYFRAAPVGERLLIHPPWESPAPDGRIQLQMDPGMAFGTGTHHTTRMCLEALEKTLQVGDRLLDLGCGSGILGIAGVLLGAEEAVCVDVDPIAENIVRDNAARNGLPANSLRVMTGDVLADDVLMRSLQETPFDVVTANIIAAVIMGLCPRIPALLKPGGVWIASGVIGDRLQEVGAAAEQNGMRVREVLQSEDWRALIIQKP